MSNADVLLLDGEAEPVVTQKPDYRVAQQRLNRQGRDARRGRQIATNEYIRVNGLELRRTRDGTKLVQVRKPLP